MAKEPTADRPYVFISYARDDQEYVKALVAHLDRHDIAVLTDADIDYGSIWPRVIRDRVDGCAALIVVMTPTSEDSEWVRREFTRAEQRNKTILPLLLDGVPFFELNTTQYEDVADRRMPSPRFVDRLRELTFTLPVGVEALEWHLRRLCPDADVRVVAMGRGRAKIYIGTSSRTFKRNKANARYQKRLIDWARRTCG